MRLTLTASKVLTDKLDKLEKKLTGKLDVYERVIACVPGELKKRMSSPQLTEPKHRRIGFRNE
jgi:hypothetical protein